jgi:hypothetical protein
VHPARFPGSGLIGRYGDDVELAYLIILIVAFIAIGAMSVVVLLKLFAGQR